MTDPAPNDGIAAALDAARPNLDIIQSTDDRIVVAHRNDVAFKEFDLEFLQRRPRRASGLVRVSSADGFINAVQQRLHADAENAAVIYADLAEMALVCVLNDTTGDGPGWRDHLVELRLERTEEWNHWLGGQGQGTQERFARTIQEGEDEIVEPSPAVMLDIAQTFHATSQSTAKQAKRLKDGRTQVVYEEDVNASAGEGGTLEIPETFTLGMRPFYGSDVFEVTARLEYTPPRGGQLQIGYHLQRPKDVERAAYSTVVDKVVDELGLPKIEGAI